MGGSLAGAPCPFWREQQIHFSYSWVKNIKHTACHIPQMSLFHLSRNSSHLLDFHHNLCLFIFTSVVLNFFPPLHFFASPPKLALILCNYLQRSLVDRWRGQMWRKGGGERKAKRWMRRQSTGPRLKVSQSITNLNELWPCCWNSTCVPERSSWSSNSILIGSWGGSPMGYTIMTAPLSWSKASFTISIVTQTLAWTCFWYMNRKRKRM